MLEGWPGEKLIIKIWDSLVDKGIGGLLAPGQIRREGRARIDVRREELLMLAQVEQDIEDVRAGRKCIDVQGNVHDVPLLEHDRPDQLPAPTDHSQSNSFLKYSLRHTGIQAVRKTLNFVKVLIKAEEAAESVPDERVSEEHVSQEWRARYRAYAEEVNDEDFQEIWGRVLAGEFQNPGTYSLRTLEFLRTLSSEEARRISQFAQFKISNFIYIKRDVSGFYQQFGFRYSDFWVFSRSCGYLLVFFTPLLCKQLSGGYTG